ncbi:DUF6289 family protein [Catenuloplanes sp. NPDC051500]|uniref:DUF6289 family protein n=1 Tax=Catenuloplanes sp. NPDC051500 TaxID=3363959 RepID=UPI00379613B0
MLLRRTLIAAVLAVAAFLAVPGSPAQARVCQLGYTCDLYFYSDSAHTTLVGGIRTYCEGDTDSWGRRTSYQDFIETPC